MPQIAQVDARVPIELVDLIAFHLRPADGLTNLSPSLKKLQDGLAGLRACSLVCHQWRAIVLPHLFFSIMCEFLPEDGLGEQPVGRRRPYKTISLFCRFLENTPAVRECIRQLLLVHQSRSSLTDGEHEFDGRLFARLLQLCPRLDVLHLRGVKFLHVSTSTLDIPQSRALKALKIMPSHEGNLQQDPSAWYTAGADVAALAFFSSIDHLHLLAPVHGTLPVRGTARPLTVRHLEVENAGHGLRALVAALERCGAVQTIRAFTMTRCVRRPMQAVSPELARLVSLLSPTLEEMTVRGMFHNIENVTVVPDLSRCMRLRALHIRFGLAVLDVWSAVVRLLGTVPPTAPLGRLDVHMALPRKSYEPVAPLAHTTSATMHNMDDPPFAIDDPTRTALSAVDEALMQVVEVHALPEVTVTYSAPRNAVAPDFVERAFARLKEAGKLRVRRERV